MAATVAVTVLLCAVVGGIGYYFAGVAIEVDHAPEYPLTIEDAENGTVTLPREPMTERSGTWALVWEGGRAMLGPIVGGDDDHVVRKVSSIVEGTLEKGAPAAIDHWLYDGDPKTALGLPFQDVTYPSEVGPMPAWLLPGTSYKRTWVIGVHGRNADKAETFRVMRAVHALGLPMMSIAYRNDVGAPPSKDGKNHLGNTEWHDIVSAIGYARARRDGRRPVRMVDGRGDVDDDAAQGPVVRPRRRPRLPVMDWGATLDKQGDARHLPVFVTDLAKRILQWRIGIDLADFVQHRYAPRLRTPVLLFTTEDDEMVANRPAFTFAEKAPPGMVTHITTPGDHTEAWNVDPAAYEGALGAFLKKVA